MRWEEIQWKRSIWLIPGEKFKNGEAEESQLIPGIVQLLRERKAADDADPHWVFSGAGRTGHLVEPKGAWKRVLRRAGIADCRIHDLRRTYGSWQAITGSSLPIIGASLGHKSPHSTAIYARLHNDPVRNSIERATRAMMVEGQMPKGLLRALPPKKQ